MLTIAQSKRFFFDRELVAKRIDAATRKALSRSGAIVMRSARKSLKNSVVRRRGPRNRPREGETRPIVERGASLPGKPPLSHTGLLRDNVLFAANPGRGRSPTVVVGPARLNKGTDAPHVLEFGGRTVVTRRRKGATQRRTVRIAARPYMGPALERESGKLPEQLRNSVLRRG